MSSDQAYLLASETQAGTWIGSGANLLWVGALSFEERCTASLRSLASMQLMPHTGLVLDYSTKTEPFRLEKARRQSNWETMLSTAGRTFGEKATRVDVDAYSFQQFQDTLQTALAGVAQGSVVVFDITCLTKIHTLSLAAFLARSGGPFRWAVAYSTPENYSGIGAETMGPGWRDIIVAPLAETAALLNEVHSRGIIIPGHEPDRLIVALSEIEPSGGTIVMGTTPKRPDLLQLSRRANRKVVSRLCRPSSGHWIQKVVQVGDATSMGSSVDQEIGRARHHKAPVVLFPFGPKSLIFFSAIELARHYPEASWFVYPIPTSYDVAYTEGIEATLWFAPRGSSGASNEAPESPIGDKMHLGPGASDGMLHLRI